MIRLAPPVLAFFVTAVGCQFFAQPHSVAADFPVQDRLYVKRALKPDEQKEIFRLSNLLIDKASDGHRAHSDRDTIAWELGEKYAHRHALPALLAVLRDPTDKPRVRQRCVIALSNIPDKRIIDPLIEALLDEQFSVAFEACDRLMRLTHTTIGDGQMGNRDPVSPERVRVYEKWRAWWDEHRDDEEVALHALPREGFGQSQTESSFPD